jgi:hypothetical protein
MLVVYQQRLDNLLICFAQTYLCGFPFWINEAQPKTLSLGNEGVSGFFQKVFDLSDGVVIGRT